MSDLPDVSGNFRSMIYKGITSTNQTSIQSTKGARSADRSVTDYLFASPWIKPIPPLSSLLLPLLLLPLAFYSRSAHSHKHTHSRIETPSLQLPTTLYHIYPQRIDEFKWAIRFLREAIGQVCGRGKSHLAYSEAMISLLKFLSSRLPSPSDRRFKVTMWATHSVSGA